MASAPPSQSGVSHLVRPLLLPPPPLLNGPALSARSSFWSFGVCNQQVALHFRPPCSTGTAIVDHSPWIVMEYAAGTVQRPFFSHLVHSGCCRHPLYPSTPSGPCLDEGIFQRRVQRQQASAREFFSTKNEPVDGIERDGGLWTKAPMSHPSRRREKGTAEKSIKTVPPVRSEPC